MSADTEDPGRRKVQVGGLLGRLLGLPSPQQPEGEDKQYMKVTANQTDGIPFGFTTFRPSDISGRRPKWYEFSYNVGDVDLPPLGVPMGPRHFKALP